MMTDSVSGFFAPEERAATGDRARGAANPPLASELSLRVLHLVAERGSVTMSALLAGVEARPRAVVAAVDDLEAAGLVTVDAADREEIVHPTEAGLHAAAG
jgi:DNA-binding MarR family transcriptional regulator